jgi:hypothetical protein
MARYKDAIQWIADNDDTEWITDPNGCESVTAALVADLFEKDAVQVRADLEQALIRARRSRAAE